VAPEVPLAPGYRELPLWHDELADPPPAASLPERADVVIVGAGYCGLTAARELAQRGRHVVVAEAGGVGAGASTRNAGMVIPELHVDKRLLGRGYGRRAGDLVAAVHDAFELIERIVREHAIDCDYRRTGGLFLAHHERQVATLRAWADELAEHGAPTTVLTGDLGAELGSDQFVAALVIDKVGAVHPARYHAGLLSLALDAGVSVHEHHRVTAIAARHDGFDVSTERGTVRAGDVLVAANAYVDGSFRVLQRRVLPVGSFMIATEPLDEALATEVIPHDRMCFDTRTFVRYWRLSPDRRMVFGGRADLAPTTVTRARDMLYREMLRVHPQLAGARVERTWGGNVAITLDALPHCGRLDGVAFATGCNGTGVALSTWFGVHMAAWMSGDEPPPVFADIPFPKVPLHGLRNAWLPAAGWALRALDRMGR
jgi:glycine/D-amino acid oxidase-like deaminating enzyme